MKALYILLSVIAFSGCHRASDLNEAILLQIRMNKTVILPPGAEFISEDNFIKNNALAILESSSNLTQINPDRTYTLYIDYETTRGFSHIGFRFGNNGSFWMVPVSGVQNSTKGGVSFQFTIPANICEDFSATCQPIEINEIIARQRSDNTFDISNIFKFSLTAVCGNCDEPSCRNFETDCKSTSEQCDKLNANLLNYQAVFEKAIMVGDTIGYCSFVTRYITTLKASEYQSCIDDNIALFNWSQYNQILTNIEQAKKRICH